MRRFLALLAAAMLVATLSSSASAAPPVSAVNHFVGDFEAIDPESGMVAGHVVADFAPPSERQVAPGIFQFNGADWYPIKSMRVAAANSLFWIDPNGGLPHAELAGAACDIFWPGGYTCHETWTVMFREWPGEPNSILFSHCWVGPTEWDFSFDTENGCAFLLEVGKGAWVLKLSAEE